jgi:NADH-quinone oxidoreductase subunit M
VQRVFYGKPAGVVLEMKNDDKSDSDLTGREWATVIPLIAMIIWLGVYPKPFLDRIEPAVESLVETYEANVALNPVDVEMVLGVSDQQEESNR